MLMAKEDGGVLLCHLRLHNPHNHLHWHGAFSCLDKQRWMPALEEICLDERGEEEGDEGNGEFWIALSEQAKCPEAFTARRVPL